MRLAIMQPYFVPYLGYLQLIHAVDRFVILDDVNFINKGWINRNRILINGQDKLVTLPLVKASQNRLINAIQIADYEDWRSKLLRTITLAYKRAPYFNETLPLIERIVSYENNQLSAFLYHSLLMLMQHLHIETEIIPSASIFNNGELKGSDRILDICMREQAQEYINPQGGTSLYSTSHFAEHKIKLHFLHSNPQSYRQFDGVHVPWLSIVDVLMFNSKLECQRMLDDFHLE